MVTLMLAKIYFIYFIVRDNKIVRDYIGDICGIIVEGLIKILD